MPVSNSVVLVIVIFVIGFFAFDKNLFDILELVLFLCLFHIRRVGEIHRLVCFGIDMMNVAVFVGVGRELLLFKAVFNPVLCKAVDNCEQRDTDDKSDKAEHTPDRQAYRILPRSWKAL